jgi:rhamnulokinase
VQSLRRELCPDKDFQTIEKEAVESGFSGIVDINDSDFLSPDSMKSAFDRAFAGRDYAPGTDADYFSAAYYSLADSYKNAIAELEANTGKHYDTLYIVGGGAKNKYLNELTEKACGIKVKALPIEATSIGNLRVQMKNV